jgi:hypothetical protein
MWESADYSLVSADEAADKKRTTGRLKTGVRAAIKDMARMHWDLSRYLHGRGKKGLGLATLMLDHLDVMENAWVKRSIAFKYLKKELGIHLYHERWDELGLPVRYMYYTHCEKKQN